MKIEFLKRFEGKEVKIILKNNWRYSGIVFEVTGEGLISFIDKNYERVNLEPEYIVSILEMKDAGP